MDIFKRLFTKTRNAGVFSFVFPQAPAGLQNREFLRAYKGWVYACVRAIANDVGTMELQLQQKRSGDWAEVKSHPALDLLSHVNPFLSSDGLYKGTSSYLDLTGNAFWYVAYNGKRKSEPAELWQLDPTKIEVVKDEQDFIKGWIYTNPQGKKINLQPWEVIPFQEFNPEDSFRGKGPVEAAALAIDTNRYAGEWNRNFFFNSAMPSMALTTEQKLTDESYDRLMAKWEEKFRGVNNAHKPAVLEGGLKVQLLNNSAKDMDFTSQGHMLRDEILAMFGVPKSVLGIVEDVNRANAEASEYVFAKRVIMPRERFIATTLSEFYLPLWGLSSEKYRLFPKDMTPQNVEADVKRKEAGLKNGWYTINEVREQEALPAIEGGDEIYLPQNLIPLTAETRGQLPAFGAPPSDDGDKDKPEDKKSVTKAVTTADDLVAGRVEFLTETIAKYQAVFQLSFEEKRTQLLRILDGWEKGFKAPRKKDAEELANELVRFLFADWDDWIGVLVNPTRDALQESLNLGGRQALAQVDININFDQLNPAVMDWLNEHALEHATSVSGTVKEELVTRVMAGVEQGLSAESIAASFNEFFDEQTQWRALRIARTEAITGYAEGALAGYRQSGLVTAKKWLTAGDATVDPECLMNQAQGAIPLEDTFASGHSAPPVHPNCKCVLQPVVPDNG